MFAGSVTMIVQRQHLKKTRLRDENMQEFGIQIEWTMTDIVGLQHLQEKNFALGVTLAW